MTENAEEVRPADRCITVPLAHLRPSKTNPRQHFDKQAMAELEESVRKHGVLQPLLVRPLNGEVGAVGHQMEVVAGERRYRAAKAAGLEAVPVLERHLSDKEVLEIQMVENLQRNDLHPLEEAEGYRQLHEKHDYSVEDLAAKIGKSKAYIYARLKLGALPPAAKKLFLEGKVLPSVALLAARIPDKGQAEKFVRDCAENNAHNIEPVTYRRAFEIYMRDYMLRLSEAPFPTADAQLVPQAGSCTSCPKRTGNQPELFGEIVKSADVCTDLVCFEKKRKAWESQEVAKLIEGGAREASAIEQKKIFPYDYDWSPARGFVDLDSQCSPLGYEKDRTWRKVLRKALDPRQVLLVRDRAEGKLHHVMTEKDARAAMKAAGVKLPKREADRYVVQDRKRKQKEKAASSFRMVVFGVAKQRAAEAAHKQRLSVPLIRAVAGHLLERLYGEGDALLKLLPKADEHQLARILVLGLAGEPNEWEMVRDYPDGLKAACAVYRIDLKKLEAEVKADKRKCRQCGCTTLKACKGGCSWIAPDLCSRCNGKKAAKPDK